MQVDDYILLIYWRLGTCTRKRLDNYNVRTFNGSACPLYLCLGCNQMVQWDVLWFIEMSSGSLRCPLVQWYVLWFSEMPSGSVRCHLVQWDVLWFSEMSSGSVRCPLVQWDVLWFSEMSFGSVRCPLVQWDVLWFSEMSSGSVRCAVVQVGPWRVSGRLRGACPLLSGPPAWLHCLPTGRQAAHRGRRSVWPAVWHLWPHQ